MNAQQTMEPNRNGALRRRRFGSGIISVCRLRFLLKSATIVLRIRPAVSGLFIVVPRTVKLSGTKMLVSKHVGE